MPKRGKTKKISIRISNEVYDSIIFLSKQNNETFSSNLNEYIEQGMYRLNTLEKTSKFLQEQEQLMIEAIKDERLQHLGTEIKALERDKYRCRKCGSKSNIMEISLPSILTGKTIAGLDSESKITLCSHCYDELKKFIPKRYELERFIEWYYKDY